MDEFQTRVENFMRKLDDLQSATDAGAAWLPICAEDDAASGALVLRLTGLGYRNSTRGGLLVVATNQPGERIWERE